MKTNDEQPDRDALDANLAKLIHKDNLPPAPSGAQKQDMLESLRRKQGELAKAPAAPASRPFILHPVFLRSAAAAVAIGCMIVLLTPPATEPISSPNPIPDLPDPPVLPVHPEPAPSVFEAITYEAVESSRRIALRDGSTAIAEKGTRFVETAPRRLELQEGSLYMLVAKADTPLEVVTPRGKALALGTRFLVSASGDESRVAVAQGSVRLVGSGGDVDLARGEEGVLAPDELVRRPAPRLSHLLGWAREHLREPEAVAIDAGLVRNGLIAVDPQGQEARLSLRKYSLDVFIEDGVARTTIDQTFFNHYHSNTEGTFYFPLPPGAAVSRMAMYVAGKRNEAGMVERHRGQQIYNDIKYANRDPALLEQLEGNLYKLRIFPLEGRQEKRIFISFTGPVDELYRTLRYWLPMDHTQDNAGKIEIKVRVKYGAELYDAKSSTHEFTSSVEGDDLLLHYEAENTKPDQDLLLQLLPKEASKRIADSSTLTRGDKHYLHTRIRPLLAGKIDPRPRQWFVLNDTSASRSAADLAAQAHIAGRLMAEADDDDTIAFANLNIDTQRLTDGLVPLRGKAAKQALATLRSARRIGGTNLGAGIAAMQKWIAESGADNPHIIYLGDGLASDGLKTTSELTASLDKNVPFVGIAVGKKADLSFLRSAANATGGAALLMNPDEGLNWRVFDMLASFNTPRLSDISWEFEGGSEGITAYSDRATLSAGEALTIVAVSDTQWPEKLTVRGVLDGEPWQEVVALDRARGEAGFIPRFWAQRHIEELLKDGEEHREEIVRLSMKHYVATPFTSLIVLENDQMYQQYKVEKGRKDHWASYPAPDQIPVVREPVQWRSPAWGAAQAEDDSVVTLAPKTAEEIVGNLLPTPRNWPVLYPPVIWSRNLDDYGFTYWNINESPIEDGVIRLGLRGVTSFDINGIVDHSSLNYDWLDVTRYADHLGVPTTRPVPGVTYLDSGLSLNSTWSLSNSSEFTFGTAIPQPITGTYGTFGTMYFGYENGGIGFGGGGGGGIRFRSAGIAGDLLGTGTAGRRADMSWTTAVRGVTLPRGHITHRNNGRFFFDPAQYELGYRMMNQYPMATVSFLPLVPALRTTAEDRASAVEMKLGREKRGSISDEAAALVRAAEAKRKPVRIDGTITAPDGRMKGDSTTPMVLKGEVVSDGTNWYHIYRELGLATRRPVTPSNLATIQSGVPHWPPSLNTLEARWDVTLGEVDDDSFELVLADPDPERGGFKNVLVIAKDGRLLASRQFVDDELVAELSFRYEGDTVTIESGAGSIERYEAVAVEVADALFAAELDDLVVLDLPLRRPAFYQKQLAALAGEKVDERKGLLRHLITARLRDTRPTALQHRASAQSEWSQLIQLGAGSTPLFDHGTLSVALSVDPNASVPGDSDFFAHLKECRQLQVALVPQTPRDRVEKFIADWPESPVLPHLVQRCADPKVWIKMLDLPRYRGLAMDKIAAVAESQNWPERGEIAARIAGYLSESAKDGDPPRVSEAFADFLTRAGKEREHWLVVVTAYRELAEDLEGLDRGDLAAVLDLALKEGDAKLEARCLDRLLDEIAQRDRPADLVALAEMFSGHGRDDVAGDLYRDALAKIEDPGAALLQSAAAALRSSDTKQSIRWELGALRKLGEAGGVADKATLTGKYNELLGRALDAGDLKAAEQIALGAYEQLPAQHALITLVASHHQQGGDATERWRWLSTILDRNPKNAEASGAIGGWYEHHAMLPEAELMYADANTFDSAHPQWLVKRAAVLYRAGEFEQADVLYRELVDTDWAHQLKGQVPNEIRVLAADPSEGVRVSGEEPGDGWTEVDFDDSAWKQRVGRFGSGDSGAALWEAPFHLRQKFELGALPRRIDLQAGLHSAACEVYINGVFAQRLEERSGNAASNDHPYRVTLSGEALEALKVGENVIALRCEKLGENPRAYVELMQVFPGPR